jgi:hypothetical protein
MISLSLLDLNPKMKEELFIVDILLRSDKRIYSHVQNEYLRSFNKNSRGSFHYRLKALLEHKIIIQEKDDIGTIWLKINKKKFERDLLNCL